MSRDQPFVRNWRDQQPANSHGAIGWKILTERGEGKPYALSPLIGLHGLTFRMLQAGMVEPAHTHEAKEHVYYIIRGRGKVQLGDARHDVADGDAVYMPARGVHGIINDSDDFIDHLVISAIPHWARNGSPGTDLDRGCVDPVIRNWRDDPPRLSHGAFGWSILAAKEQFRERTYEQAPLEGFHGMTMHLMAAGRSEAVHAHADKEQVYYFTEGRGRLVLGDETVNVRDGDAAYIPPGTPHGLINDGREWIQHLILSALIQS